MMKFIVICLLVGQLVPLTMGEGSLRELKVSARDDTKPECTNDNDCPTINCITTPCPQNRCQNNTCVAVIDPECVKDKDCPKVACKGIGPCPVNVCRKNVCVLKVLPPRTMKPRTKKPFTKKPFTMKPRPVKPKVSRPVNAPVTLLGDQCGNTTCRSDESCCNPSCSICTKDGTGCHKRICLGTKQCGKNVCGDDEECCNPSCGICTKKGDACNTLACVDPECTDDSGCPQPPCLPPIDGIDSYCPVPKCVDGKCVVDPPADYCENTSQCPSVACDPPEDGSPSVCPISKCIDNKCQLVPPPEPGMCYDVDDCPVPSCPAPPDGMPFSCPFPKCVDKICVYEKPSDPQKCGIATCTSDEYCCNESCGICLNKNSKVRCVTDVCDPSKKCQTDLDCAAGTICDVDGQCVDAPQVQCGNILCKAYQYCCNKSCGDCMYIWEKRMCNNEICSPAVQCIENTDCKEGLICDEMKQCVEPPKVGEQCGNVMCTADEYCCNKSCGDCIHKMMGRPCSSTECVPAVQCRFDTDCKVGYICDGGQCVVSKSSIPCGNTTCIDGDVCCNPLCNICTKPDMMCPMGC
jgi:hypothetical protein